MTKKRGFTLIELMVVIGIISIIIAIAVPNFAGIQQRARIRSGAQQIAQDLRQIRERALSIGQRFLVTRPDDRHYQVTSPNGTVTTYRLGQTTGGHLRFGVSAGVSSTPPEANQPSPPANGFDFPTNTLILEPRGAASKGVIYVTDGRENYAVGINSLGKIRVYIYGNGAWSGL
ncbi:type II secretion system protein GspH [candidate division WOR-3 bacterium 4484_100]|uniref:Type II secretion system protein GspH n=1 Tax=candidate division WOR-3 bacterium 4484_100 TaxID=1936077 RepID=A0A1V4QHZ0_UNCW3|nr:MAG: type II secretion system protein GspH [candidate division WOR-3 bacterium 4484_100]